MSTTAYAIKSERGYLANDMAAEWEEEFTSTLVNAAFFNDEAEAGTVAECVSADYEVDCVVVAINMTEVEIKG